jgi:hypothetical protein
MTRIVTYAHRYKRPPRKRKPVALEAPAVVTTTSRKRAKLLRADKRAAEPDNDPEAAAQVKAFFARMIRPGGALPPEKP